MNPEQGRSWSAVATVAENPQPQPQQHPEQPRVDESRKKEEGATDDATKTAAETETIIVDSSALAVNKQPAQQPQSGGNTGTTSSKLESLSREDLIKLVKKQLVNQKELKKQLEAAKAEVQASAQPVSELEQKQDKKGCGGVGAPSSMLQIELDDYKNAIAIVRRELQECRDTLAGKESLVEELSQRIAQLQEERETISEELKRKLAEANELKQTLEERSQVIAENSKEIQALVAQLNESRQQMHAEIGALQAQLHGQAQQLAAGERADAAKGAELRRLRSEHGSMAERLASVQEEFALYKERAEYALKSRSENAGTGGNNGNGNNENVVTETAAEEKQGNNNSGRGELDQLVDLLRQRNAQISQLSAKCSFLEEEVRSGQQHAKTLVDELNAVHDQMADVRRQAQQDRQRLAQEWAERLRVEEKRRAQLDRELAEARAGEKALKAEALETEVKWREKCQRLTRQLEEAAAEKEAERKKSISSTANGEVQQKQRQQRSKNNQQQPAKQRMRRQPLPAAPLTPLNLNSSGDSLPSAIARGLAAEEEREGREGMIGDEFGHEMDEEEGMNSESSEDSLEGLQSMLAEAETGPESEIPTFNVASLADGSSIIDSAADGPHQQQHGGHGPPMVSEEQYRELQKQMADCMELLSESEENNVRLSEQVAVLKEEIRRLERNQKRAEQLMGNQVCSEYFKNIVLKFLAPPRVNDERSQLLPVLQTILHLDARELEQVRQSCQQQPAVMADDDDVGPTTTAENGGGAGTGNGSSLVDWSSLFGGWK